MKRKLVLSIAALAMFSTMPAFADATATNNNNYSVTLELIRSKNIDKLIDRVNSFENYAKLYMYQTGDINPTTSKIINYFKLPSSIAANFTTGTIQLSVDNNGYKFTFSKLFNNLPSQDLINMEKASTELQPIATVSSDGENIVIPYDAKTIQYVMTIKNLPSAKTVVSSTQPTDITKVWYQPNGKGDFNVYQYSGGKWVDIGGLKKDGFVVNDVSDLNNLSPIVTIGAKAYVKDNGKLDTYVFDGSNWNKINVDANNNGEVYNSSSMPTCNSTTKGKIIYVKDSSGSVKQDICDGSGHWLDLNARSELEKKLYSDKSALPTCSADLSGIELFVSKGSSALGYVCDGKGDWVASAGSGSGDSNIPAGAVIIPGIWGTTNFDDTPQFKNIVGTTTPFCDDAKPAHCFKNWNDFVNKSDCYKGVIFYTVNWSYFYTINWSYLRNGGDGNWQQEGDYWWFSGWKKVKWNQSLVYQKTLCTATPNWPTHLPSSITKYPFILNAVRKNIQGFGYAMPIVSYFKVSGDCSIIKGEANKPYGYLVWYKPKGSPAP